MVRPSTLASPDYAKELVRAELLRLIEFARLALNRDQLFVKLKSIAEEFSLDFEEIFAEVAIEDGAWDE